MTSQTAVRVDAASRRRVRLVLTYGGLAAAAIAAFASHEAGATLHSVVSIAVIGVIAWHVTTQRGWVRAALRRRLAHPQRALVLVNTALATSFAVSNLTGVPVWLWDVGGVVGQLHLVSSVAFMVIALAHLVLNRRALVAQWRAATA